MNNILDRIKLIADNEGIKITTLETKIGASKGVLSRAIKNKTDIQSKWLIEIVENYPRYNTNWLLTGVGEILKSDIKTNNLVQESQAEFIPLIPIEAMAGKGNNGSVQILQKDIIGGYVIPEFTQRGVEYIIRVSGSSMYPKYSSGDLLGCKTVNDTSFFQWGKIYVLDTDQGPMVKRLFPTDKENILECRSDNKDYPPFPINKDSIYKIAIVIGVLRLE